MTINFENESSHELNLPLEELQGTVPDAGQLIRIERRNTSLRLSQKKIGRLFRIAEPFQHLHGDGIHGGVSLALGDWRRKRLQFAIGNSP